ncbi:transcriptional regulator [Paucilactobacillus hokkaidonensis JCM 18461]|uniref:Transcriptional regulator n=4 Tax=Paucilactobacillus hokkaidonensis TaxID=1193095 RepID=A0A0A1GW98_9LACO|nr:PadR family transcriptional regulator [Paucilactobacillus hokkaidonensis]KRO10258.1 LaaE [Paucilactobacillus hokkaidonensis]BAP86275.1 transcriptional regulator [Paucilactobacillus hokkaidonensis JCM 18461]
MYELLILGVLRGRDMSGYKLGLVLEGSLVPRREISNGVLYPLINRLAAQGYIEITEKHDGPRNKKMTHITELGKQRFQELMMAPVSIDSKRESIYRFKFRSMDGVKAEAQHKILAEYEANVQTDLNIYQQVQVHLKEKMTSKPTDYERLKSAVRALELSIDICKTKQNWIDNYKVEMKQEEKQNGTKE